MKKFEKKQIDCYKIFNVNGCGWAVIVIDDLGESGRIMIASDYGDFSYFWSHCGSSFKQFLQKLNLDYVADKFRQDDYLDSKATTDNYKQAVLESRRYNGMEKDYARKIYNEIKSLEYLTKENFGYEISQCPNLLRFYDGCPEYTEKVRPQFNKFWEEIWQPFLEEIQIPELQAV